MERRLTELWAELHTAQDQTALLQAPAEGGAGCISYAALRQWVREVHAALAVRSKPQTPNAADAAHERMVVAISVTPCSVEETALLLMVAEQPHWVYVPVDEHLPLLYQLAVLDNSRANRLVVLPTAPLARFFRSSDRKVKGESDAKWKRTVALSSGPFRPVHVFSFPLASFLPTTRTSQYLESLGAFSESPGAEADTAAPFYVLSTSGSTGKPRGVVGTRVGAWSRLQWMWRAYPFDMSPSGGPQECVLRATRLSFVDSVWEVLGAFLQRVPLVHIQTPRRSADADNQAEQTLVQSVVLDDVAQFLEVVKTFRVTRFTAVPSVLEMLLLQTRVEDRRAAFAGLRYVLSSGETLPWGLAHQLTSELPHVTLLNLYGSTEVSGDVTCVQLKAPLAPHLVALWSQHGVPIGSLSNGGVVGDKVTSLLLVPDGTAEHDCRLDHLQINSGVLIWPPNASGELQTLAKSEKAPVSGILYVSGPLVALGYVGDGHDKERDVFVEHCPRVDGQKTEAEDASNALSRRQRWVCTGDICSVIGGQLYFCGRRDDTVKIRGQRVHLGAVERMVAAALAYTSGSGPDSDDSDEDIPLWHRYRCQPIALAALRPINRRGLQQQSVVVFLVLNDKRKARFADEEHQKPARQSSERGNGTSVSVYAVKQTLYRWIEETYGAVHVPSEVLTVHSSALQQTPRGKVDRRALEALYAEYTAEMCSQAESRGESASKSDADERPEVQLLLRVLSETLGVRASTGDYEAMLRRTLMELGGNSLLATILRFELQQECERFAVTAQDLLGMRVGDILSALSSSFGETAKQTVKLHPRSPDLRPGDDKDIAGGTSKRRKITETTRSDEETSSDLAHRDVTSPSRLAFLSRYNQSSKARTAPWIPKCYSTVADQSLQGNAAGEHGHWGLRSSWRVDLGKCIDASPLVVQRHDACGDVVSTWAIVGSHSALLVCADVEDSGKEIWRTKLDDRIEACAALSVKHEMVYVGTYAGTFYALELSSGKLKWHISAGTTIKASGLVIDAHELVICGAYDHKLYGLDAATGAKKWSVDLGGSIFSTPVYWGSSSQLFVASTTGRVIALEIKTTSVGSVSTQWSFQLPSPVFAGLNVDAASQMLVVGCADGKLYGLEAMSGEPRWELATGKPIFSSPCVYRSGNLVVGSHDGVLRKVRCKNGELLWATDLRAAIFASPTVVEFVTTPTKPSNVNVARCSARRREGAQQLVCCVGTIAGRLYFCDEESGSILFQTDQSSGKPTREATAHESDGALGPLFASPVITGKWCLLGTRTNHLYGLELVSSRAVQP